MPESSGSGETVLPGIVDHHVHLGLVDHALLAGGPVVEVHDLGWDPAVVLGLRAAPPDGVTVRVAGPFHTAPGGYPSGRSWAPDAAVRAIGSAGDARAAIDDAVVRRYDVVKVALHSGMALLDDVLLGTLVELAHGADLPVAVHAEGPGQAARAVAAGADVLVHAPWSEWLTDDVLARALGTTWISTLAIHGPAERAVAIDNVRRFRALGGRVRYGTDMGNGPTPVGLNAEEIRLLGEAGLSGGALLGALAGDRPGPLLASPHPLPTTADEVVRWYADAHRLPLPETEETHGPR